MIDSQKTIILLENELKHLLKKGSKIKGIYASSQLFTALNDANKFVSYVDLPEEYQKLYSDASVPTTDRSRAKFYKLSQYIPIIIEDITYLGKEISEKYKLEDFGIKAFYIDVEKD